MEGKQGVLFLKKRTKRLLSILDIPFIPPAGGDMLGGWKRTDIPPLELITRRPSERWTSGSATTKVAETISVVCDGRGSSPARIAEGRVRHGRWREGGYGAGPAAKRRR